LLAVKKCLFIENDILSKDNNTFVWNPDSVNIGGVIANKIADMGLQI